MLTRHPDQYDNGQLEEWVRHLIDERVQEGPRLDYKESISLSSPGERREAAKDISSFANEIGGTLLYGVAEDREAPDIALPRDPYGIDPIPGLEQSLENVYVDAIRPALAEWRIKKIDLTAYPGKVVYLVWTPESWLGPHMVEGYKEHRYYRRGQLRAVLMAEHEVRDRHERLFTSTQRSLRFVDELETGTLAAKFDNPCGSHYLTYPLGLTYDRVDFRAPEMLDWLKRNRTPSTAEWKPALMGAQTELERNPQNYTHAPWNAYGRLTQTGAYSLWRHTRVELTSAPNHEVKWVEGLEEVAMLKRHLEFAAGFYSEIGYIGPLRVRLRLNSTATPTLKMPAGYQTLHEYHGEPPLVVEVDTSAADLSSSREQVTERLHTELAAAFGLLP